MHDFQYVTKKEAAPVKTELLDIIHDVQNILREKFTFRYDFIGSSSRNMITEDKKSNIGFDFDVNIEVNDDEEDYSAKELRTLIREAIDRVAPKYGYNYCEDSTRVLTIKKVDKKRCRIVHSCDFAIVNTYEDGKQEYIRFNKPYNYTWEKQGNAFDYWAEKIEFLKENKLWNDFRDYYIYKKNSNTNPDKHSRSIFAEALNEMCAKNGY